MKKYDVIAYQLTRPISYLFLKHQAGKVYNWIIPTFLTGLSLMILVSLAEIDDITGENGLVANLTDFVISLPGFLIAALAAIATFNRPIIDQEMIDAPTIDIKAGNTELFDQPLTRRGFLLRLFSFLTVDSIFLIIYAKVGSITSVPSFLESPFHIAEWLFVSIFLLIFWQLLTLLLFGMYYLCERLNLNI
ncbi:hypothetical protein [Shewanella colwelliana]|uniref:hypothetical protein n=1 Tax=Shewanella colwelliana TaxID=23 RepID=UPI000563BB7A|nr:hypothetical protein [Shewanella colwelliana]